MYRIFYVSEPKPGISEAEVERLIQEAKLHNDHHWITGAIGYDGKKFAQLIEGDHQKIRHLMKKITSDKRHKDVKILRQRRVTERAYFGFGRVTIDDKNYGQFFQAMDW